MFAMDYLLKTEPTVYSFANLEKDKSTIWDGVTNPVAVKNLRAMNTGDRLVVYHTGDEKSAVGSDRRVGGGQRCEDSSGKDQGWEGDCSSENAGRDQSIETVCRLAAGAARKIECGAAFTGAVSGVGWSLVGMRGGGTSRD